MSTLATFIQRSFGSPSHGNQRRKVNKRNTNWQIRSTRNATRTLPGLSMNLVNLQITKLRHRNLLHSYTLMMKNLKEKLRKHSHLPLQQKE